jgi:hypothetical protein
VQAGDVGDGFCGLGVDDFKRVVAQGGDEEAVVFSVGGEVVEAPFDAREGIT